MSVNWQLKAPTNCMTVETGDALLLKAGVLYSDHAECPGCPDALIAMNGRFVRIAAAPGSLTINGRRAPGGVAVRECADGFRFRIGSAEVTLVAPGSSVVTDGAAGAGTCALSGERLLPGDSVTTCACGCVVLSRFVAERGVCVRCGRRLPTAHSGGAA